MTVSVVIPAYKRPDLLARCLESLRCANGLEALVEVIVVENGVRAGCEKICADFSDCLPIRYYFLEVGSASAARNFGSGRAQGHLVLFLDDDVKAGKSLLTAYLLQYLEFGDARFYGGALVADYEIKPSTWLEPLLPASAAGFSLGEHPKDISEPAFLGGNLAVPRKLCERLELFDALGPSGDSNSGFIGEETRLQLRLIRAGLVGRYVPDALVFHWVPADRCSFEWLQVRRSRSGRTEARLQFADANATFPFWVLKVLAKVAIRVVWSLTVKRNLVDVARSRLMWTFYSAFLREYISLRFLRRETK